MSKKKKNKISRVANNISPAFTAPVTTQATGYGQGYDYLASVFGGNYGYIPNSSEQTFGFVDMRVPPAALQFVCSSPVPFRMIEMMKTLLFKNGWSFGGGKNKSKLYTVTLQNLGFDEIKADIWYALVGASGGNALLLIEKRNGNLRLRLEPFIAEGMQRVKVYADYKTRKIQKYAILNGNKEVQTILPQNCIHIGLARPDGNFCFYTSPASVAAQAVNLKWQIFTASETIFSNGMNFNKVISPDYSAAKDASTLNELIKINKELSLKLAETQGLRNRNKDFYSSVPLNVTKVGTSNSDMQMSSLIQEVNKEISAAFGSALSNLGFTESANYSTSIQNRDNLAELNVEGVMVYFQELMEKIMYGIFPDYDPESEPAIFGKDYSAEDIEIRQQNTELFKLYLAAEQAAPGKFELDDKILQTIGFKKAEEKQQVLPPEEESLLKRATVKPAKSVQDLLESSVYKTSKNRIKKALTKQLVDNL